MSCANKPRRRSFIGAMLTMVAGAVQLIVVGYMAILAARSDFFGRRAVVGSDIVWMLYSTVALSALGSIVLLRTGLAHRVTAWTLLAISLVLGGMLVLLECAGRIGPWIKQ